METSSETWLDEMEAQLRKACTSLCVGRDGMLDTCRELLPEPTPSSAWLVRREGDESDELVLYAISGGWLHEVRATCVHLEPHRPDSSGTSKIKHTRTRLPCDASFACTTTRTQDSWADRPAVRTRQWSFELGMAAPLVVDVDPASNLYGRPSAEQLEVSARSLAQAVEAATARVFPDTTGPNPGPGTAPASA